MDNRRGFLDEQQLALADMPSQVSDSEVGRAQRQGAGVDDAA